jgi:hypothetical protein
MPFYIGGREEEGLGPEDLWGKSVQADRRAGVKILR